MPPRRNGAAPTDSCALSPANWTEAIEPFAIADGLYWVGSADLSSYLFTSDAGHILIDAPLEENVDLVLRNVEKLGFKPRDIKIVLASHGHFDHTGGMATMLERTGAQLLLSPEEAKLVGAGGKGDFFLADRAAYKPAQAARTLAPPGDGARRRSGADRPLHAGPHQGLHVVERHRQDRGPRPDLRLDLQPHRPSRLRARGRSSLIPGHRARLLLERGSPAHAHAGPLPGVRTARSSGSPKKPTKLRAGDARAFVDPAGYAAYLDRAQAADREDAGGPGIRAAAASVCSLEADSPSGVASTKNARRRTGGRRSSKRNRSR